MENTWDIHPGYFLPHYLKRVCLVFQRGLGMYPAAQNQTQESQGWVEKMFRSRAPVRHQMAMM